MKLEYFTPASAAPKVVAAAAAAPAPQSLFAAPADRPRLRDLAGVIAAASVVAFGVVVLLGIVLA